MIESQKKEFVFCLDSDGCAIDAMTIKHQKAFGPEIIKVYGLSSIEEDFLDLWDQLNLYTSYRGINRFAGLLKSFEMMEAKGYQIPPYDQLKIWIGQTSALSTEALIDYNEVHPSDQLSKAIRWSHQVNDRIQSLDGAYGAFDYVKESLARMSEVGVVYVVSSANRQAIAKEWEDQGLMDYVDGMYGQEAGSKAQILKTISKKTKTEKDRMLMVGDALSDQRAAEDAGFMFYPIFAGQEDQSWKDLKDIYLPDVLNFDYLGPVEDKMKNSFNQWLKPM